MGSGSERGIYSTFAHGDVTARRRSHRPIIDMIGMVMFLFGRLGRCIPPLDDAFSHFCRFQIENMPGKYLQLVALFAKSSSFETILTI